jgi:hypothetical protein
VGAFCDDRQLGRDLAAEERLRFLEGAALFLVLDLVGVFFFTERVV